MTVIVGEKIVQGHAIDPLDDVERVQGSTAVAVARFDNSALPQEQYTPPGAGCREWWPGVHDW